MNIIKLDAIDSTNLFLKKMAEEKDLENYSVVITDHQFQGRGQMGTSWVSEKGKNLTFSVLIKFPYLEIQHQFYISMAVALAVATEIQQIVKNSLNIKWPNDILADGHKVSGILIENMLKGQFVNYAIVGVGLNVNQTIFPENIGKVSSLKLLTGESYNLEELMLTIVKNMKYWVDKLNSQAFTELKAAYYNFLFKFGKPAVFVDNASQNFMGKIVGIAEDGQLMIEDENEIIRKFNLKEVKFADFN